GAPDRRRPARGRRAAGGAAPPRPPPRGRMTLFAFPFMVHALEAGTIVAVLAAIVGWYMVLRRQAFAGHTLSLMAFPGATGAALAGLPASVGYYLACGGAAIAMGRSGRPSWRGH